MTLFKFFRTFRSFWLLRNRSVVFHKMHKRTTKANEKFFAKEIHSFLIRTNKYHFQIAPLNLLDFVCIALTYPWLLLSEAVSRRCSKKLPKKVFTETSQNPQENTCKRVSLLMKLQAEACNFIKKETLAQVFSCELCEISKNTFLTENLRWLLLSYQSI